MGMQSVQATKEKLVDEILFYGTYMPSSGMIQRLRSVLLKLSKDDLGCLKLIIDIKMSDAADRRHDILVGNIQIKPKLTGERP